MSSISTTEQLPLQLGVHIVVVPIYVCVGGKKTSEIGNIVCGGGVSVADV